MMQSRLTLPTNRKISMAHVMRIEAMAKRKVHATFIALEVGVPVHKVIEVCNHAGLRVKVRK